MTSLIFKASSEMNHFIDYYHLLNLSPGASSSEIKASYRKLAMLYHPDKGGNSEQMKKINEAYNVLSHSVSKKIYDVNYHAHLHQLINVAREHIKENELTQEQFPERSIYLVGGLIAFITSYLFLPANSTAHFIFCFGGITWSLLAYL